MDKIIQTLDALIALAQTAYRNAYNEPNMDYHAGRLDGLIDAKLAIKKLKGEDE